MPQKRRGKAITLVPPSLSVELQTALEARYGHYSKTFQLWQAEGIDVPPRFMVVYSDTSASKLVSDFVSVFDHENDEGVRTAVESGLWRVAVSSGRPSEG